MQSLDDDEKGTRKVCTLGGEQSDVMSFQMMSHKTLNIFIFIILKS
jgi:hypothetical protein